MSPAHSPSLLSHPPQLYLHTNNCSANLTNLRHYRSVNLTTKTSLQCERFTEHFFYLKHNIPGIQNSTYSCKSTPPPQFSPKQTLALGLGLGIPLSIIAAAVVWWVAVRNNKVKRRKAVDAGLRANELSNVVRPRREEGSSDPLARCDDMKIKRVSITPHAASKH